MIRDLSETMRAILDDPALAASFPELAAAQILFDRPVEQFSPAQSTINLFLYDVRENMELRSNEPIIERNNGQATIHRAPMRVLCSYLLTAWPVGGPEPPLQEHRLLSQALQVLSQFPTITAPYLKGKLVGQEPPLPMITAQTDGLKNPAEFWTALGNKLRPSISLTVTISMQPFAPETATLAAASDVRVGVRTSPTETKIRTATLQGPFRVVGNVTDAANAPIAGATVAIASLGLTVTADASGVYSFAGLPPGTYSTRVQKGSKKKTVSLTVPAPVGSNYNLKLT
ncbi:MAG TPA: Pvc16 family protein [Blastocatellia bacterium]|nr:Pvc16 family protein [Blastocatellia bacterium]